MEVTTHSVIETIAWGRKFAESLRPGDVVCLCGDLGAGKTTLMRGIAEGLGVPADTHVTSPTFAIMHIYQGRLPIYHFDCYRLESADDLNAVGFDEFVAAGGGIACVEWPEKADGAIPAGAYWMELSVVEENSRNIKVGRK